MRSIAPRRTRGAPYLVGGHPAAARGLIGAALAVLGFVPAMVVVKTITSGC